PPKRNPIPPCTPSQMEPRVTAGVAGGVDGADVGGTGVGAGTSPGVICPGTATWDVSAAVSARALDVAQTAGSRSASNASLSSLLVFMFSSRGRGGLRGRIHLHQPPHRAQPRAGAVGSSPGGGSILARMKPSASRASSLVPVDRVRAEWTHGGAAWERWEPVLLHSLAAVDPVLLRSLELRPRMRVLDVGSGLGEPALTIARWIEPGGSVLGLDISPSMIDVARRRARLLRISNAWF